MQLRLSALIIGVGLGFSVGMLPAQAQFSDSQVRAFVEALRQAAPQTGRANDGLYSDWQVQPQNIPRWSRLCTGREITPAQFEASVSTARGIITCVVRDVLRDEYRAGGSNETIAVRRAAAWWMTGDPNRYDRGDTATYTQKVLTLYQQGRSTPAATSSAAPTTPSRTRSTAYDRYMVAGYEATKQKAHQTALLHFRRALDERPEDPYALQAIRNVETYLKPNRSGAPGKPAASSTPATSTTTASSLTQQQAVSLINTWLQAKATIFAPPFDQKQLNALATGELYTSLVRPDGLIDWLKENRAYYRYGVQKVEAVERFVSSQNRATIELKVTEDRTLYLNGTIEPGQTDFSARRVRYSLEQVNGSWKIADYKTVEGSLLERSVLGTSSSERR